jgi:hypothetical protein
MHTWRLQRYAVCRAHAVFICCWTSNMCTYVQCNLVDIDCCIAKQLRHYDSYDVRMQCALLTHILSVLLETVYIHIYMYLYIYTYKYTGNLGH